MRNSILILDDDKIRHKQFSKKYNTEMRTHVYSVEEAKKSIESNSFDYMFLNHDLGGEQMVSSGEGTGYELAKWIAEDSKRFPQKAIFIHSLNSVGRKNIKSILDSVGISNMETPFIWKS